MRLRSSLYIFLLVVCSTSATYFVTVSTAQQGSAVSQGNADTQYQVGGALYMQKAAEYRALAYQAFNLARWQLDADFDKKNVKKLPKAEQKKPRAIMVDIDETMLDNSPAQAYQIKHRVAFNLKDWYTWGEMRKAKAIPGSVEFMNYATAKGVKVFYVSNRDEVQRQATIDNLKNVGFSDVSNENLLLRQLDADGKPFSPKGPRRDSIMQKYRIVLQIGDNLDDFSGCFEKKPISERFSEADKFKSEFGRAWIVLPNAMYGTWENAIYDYGRLSEAQKAEKRISALELP